MKLVEARFNDAELDNKLQEQVLATALKLVKASQGGGRLQPIFGPVMLKFMTGTTGLKAYRLLTPLEPQSICYAQRIGHKPQHGVR